MSLSDIKNELYKKTPSRNLSAHEESEFNAEASSGGNPPGRNAVPDNWGEKKGGLNYSQKRIIKIGAIVLGSVLLVVAALFGFFKYKQSSFEESRVTLAIDGLKEVRSGKLLAYEISYKNSNRADLKNATLKISYPENFQPEENPNFKEEGPTIGSYYLGNIAGNSESKVVFNGRAYSSGSELIYLKTELIYTPSTFNSPFVSNTQLGISITSTPINLALLAPERIAGGDAIEYLINYENVGQEDFDSVRIKIDYPEGFTFSKAAPATSESDNIWYIGHLSAGQEGKIVISGKMEGANDEIKTAKVYVGTIKNGNFLSYGEEAADIKIAASPLTITQTVNDQKALNANAGDLLNYQITYKNVGDKTLKDLIVTEQFDSSILDYATLVLEKGGAFNPEKQIVTWKASDHPELGTLEPGKEGVIKFSVKIKSMIPVKIANDKNFVASSVAKIDSPDIQTPLAANKIIAGNKIDVKLNSKLILETLGYYKDQTIPNSGPIPPVVGQETTYTMHWKVTNISNDLMDAQVTAVLPTYVSMTGKLSPEDASIVYNPRTNMVTWTINNISAGTGLITPAREVSFQVKIVPLPAQISSSPELLGSSTLTAKDLFTTESLSVTAEAKKTLLREDPTIEFGGQVKPAV